jgi:hypothetical protein
MSMKLAISVFVFALLAATLWGQAQFGPNDLFVAVNGNDAWSGRLAEPNAGKTDGPLPSPQAAMMRIRQLKASAAITLPVAVWIRGGTYQMRTPLNFSPEDSGPVTFAAYPGEQPVLDGGERIKDWTEQRVNGATVWVADVHGMLGPRDGFRSLYVNGQRRQRARLPKKGAYRILDVPGHSLRGQLFDGSDTIKVTAGEVRNWKNLHDVEIRVLHFWTDERMPIERVDESTGIVKSDRTSIFSLQEGYTGKWAEYWIENVFESLGSEPGEWYLDRAEKKLYYVPMPGESTASTEVVAPVIYQFVRLNGDPDSGQYVTGITFKGLTFRYSDWVQPEQDGKYFDPYVSEEDRRKQDSTARFVGGTRGNKKMAATPQSAVNAPGAISLAGARNSAVIDCRIEHTGFWGINLADGVQNITVEGNTITDIGGGGIKVDGADYPSPPARFSGNNRITDNVVRTGGRVFMTAAGIIVTHGFGNLIAHNEISEMYQIGISAGWDWARKQTVSHDNRIEYNHIFHLGQKLSSDMGGVYLLGVQPGTAVRNNLIHDVEHAHYGGWGIYTDAATADVVIENNIVYDVSTHAILTNNTGSVPNREIQVRNNIFAFGRQGVARVAETWQAKRRNPDGRAATYLHNIFVADGQQLYVVDFRSAPPDARNDIFISDLNLFWDVSGKIGKMNQPTGQNNPPAMSVDEWKALGSDRHSIFADPMFRDLKTRDFTPGRDSPAWAVGFEPIDMSTVGPRPPEKRR